MVSMRRLPGPKNPAEMTYYAQLNGAPITGTTAAKTLSSLDSQTMALTLGYFVQVQAERKLVISLRQCYVTLSYIMQASHAQETQLYLHERRRPCKIMLGANFTNKTDMLI